jgi:hypothetical protein
MTPQADNLENLPQEHLDGEDVIALDCIIYGYLCYLRRYVPASKKRDEEIKMLEDVHHVLVLAQREEIAAVAIPLSNEYLEVLVDASKIFIKLIRRRVPASAERDQKLARLEDLRRRLARVRAQQLN